MATQQPTTPTHRADPLPSPSAALPTDAPARDCCDAVVVPVPWLPAPQAWHRVSNSAVQVLCSECAQRDAE